MGPKGPGHGREALLGVSIPLPSSTIGLGNASRGKREKAATSAEPSSPDEAPEDAAIPDGPYLDHLRRRDKIPRPPPLSAQPLATPA